MSNFSFSPKIDVSDRRLDAFTFFPLTHSERAQSESFQKEIYRIFVQYNTHQASELLTKKLEQHLKSQLDICIQRLQNLSPQKTGFFRGLKSELKDHPMTEFFLQNPNTSRRMAKILSHDVTNEKNRAATKKMLVALLQDYKASVIDVMKISMLPRCLKYVQQEFEAEDDTTRFLRNSRNINKRLLDDLYKEAVQRLQQARYQGWPSVGINLFRVYESGVTMVQMITNKNCKIPALREGADQNSPIFVPR